MLYLRAAKPAAATNSTNPARKNTFLTTTIQGRDALEVTAWEAMEPSIVRMKPQRNRDDSRMAPQLSTAYVRTRIPNATVGAMSDSDLLKPLSPFRVTSLSP